jgi:integrase
MTGRTRKANGESWVSETPNRDGYYEAKVWMGLKPNGEPDRRHVQRKDLAAVKKRVKELEKRRDAGLSGKAGKLPTVEQMLTRHLEVVLPARNRAPRTIADYRSKCVNDIFPRWGGTRIDRLLPEYLEEGYAEMLDEGHAPSHVLKVHIILNSAYKAQAKRSRAYGLAGGTILVNPCEYVDPPDAVMAEKRAMSRRQAQAVLREAEKRGNWMRWAYGMATGNRQGEALALRWPFLDIDVPEGEPGEARVAWQLQRLTWEHGCAAEAVKAMRKKGDKPEDIAKAAAKIEHECALLRCEWQKKKRPVPCPPDCRAHARNCPARRLPQGCIPVSGALVLREVKEKRRRAAKVVAVAPELCGPLREHRARQYEQKILAGAEWHEHGFVFCRWNGDPVDPRQDWQEWNDLQAAAGVEHQGTHSTRRTAATIAVDEGVALSVVKEMLGHSDIRVTEGYVHTSTPMAQRASRRIGKALFGESE